MNIEQLIVIFIVAFIAESYGAVVGGGSFVIQPFLIYMGVPPLQAVSHDIIAGFASDIGGLVGFAKKEKSSIRVDVAKNILLSVIFGSISGLYTLYYIVNEDFIRYFISIIAIVMLVLSWKPNFVLSKVKNTFFTNQIIGFSIGFYISFSSAGTGIFATILLTSILKLSIIESIATKKILFAPAFLISSSYLLGTDFFIWELGITLILASLLAGFFGVYLVIFLGENKLKYLFRITVIFLAFYLLFYYK